MKKTLISLLLSCCALWSVSAADVIAFPGAQGFGKYATGGRSGKVYHVTNLNDSGTGSFRDAVSSPNRIVVFDVGGYINLKTAVQVKSNITIAGQTAPGDGIGIAGGKVSCGSQSNIIIRHLRMRPGSNTASQKDDGLNMLKAENCIIDHCSVEFSPWNNIGGSGTNADKSTDITFQYCLIANPIYQQFGAHIESVNSQWTWFANCFANTHNRNPLDKVNDVFVNNILYNYQAGYTTHTSTKFSHDLVNNYFVAGPSSSTDNTWFQVDENQSFYTSGNMKDRNKDGVLSGSSTTPTCYKSGKTFTTLTSPWSSMTNTLPTMTAATAYRAVSSLAGVRPVDEIDDQIWSNVYSLGKEGKMYKSQTETGLSNDGFGVINGGTKETDTDNDGMPDYWELANNLDINKDDAMNIGSDGYANIERYINWLGDLHKRTPMGTSVTIDLEEYTEGWSNVSPSYKVANAKNGTVSISGSKATFTPTENFYGMAQFDFTVTGSDGTSFTTTVYVLVEYGQKIVYENPYLQKQGGGSSNQTLLSNTALTAFNYYWENAQTVEVSWTPSEPAGITINVDESAHKIYFAGTPRECGSWAFTVSTVGATTTVSKSGSINVVASAYRFNTTATGVYWTANDGWDKAAVPFNCDTAYIESGEVNVSSDVRATTIIQSGSTFRLRGNMAARELQLNGGTLKSYTSNPQFRLTVNELNVIQNSVITAGSTDTSEFKISGIIKGEGNLTKTASGILTLNVNASDYFGSWTVEGGIMQVISSNGLGKGGATLTSGSKMIVAKGNTTGVLSVAFGATLQLDADLTVVAATFGGQKISEGKYTSADYPEYISGSATLIVLEGSTNVVEAIDEDVMFALSPNPTDGVANLKINARKAKSVEIETMTQTGVVLQKSNYDILEGVSETEIDLTEYQTGVYYIRYNDADFVKVFKLIRK